MSVATDLLKAQRIGIRDLKEHVSAKILKGIFVVTDHGAPISVNLPYREVIELVDILDEIADSNTLLSVADGRRAIQEGNKGVPVKNLFKKISPKKK